MVSCSFALRYIITSNGLHHSISRHSTSTVYSTLNDDDDWLATSVLIKFKKKYVFISHSVALELALDYLLATLISETRALVPSKSLCVTRSHRLVLLKNKIDSENGWLNVWQHQRAFIRIACSFARLPHWNHINEMQTISSTLPVVYYTHYVFMVRILLCHRNIIMMILIGSTGTHHYARTTKTRLLKCSRMENV